MAKPRRVFVCQECGASQSQWAGQCPACNAWNTLVEETPRAAPPGGLKSRGGRRAVEFVPLAGAASALKRLVTGIAEFDRVAGGGLVPGSATLVGGDPGIGKSTVLLQVAGALAGPASGKDSRVVYVSGEEAIDQVRLRAERLGLSAAQVDLAAATNVGDILAGIETGPPPTLLVIDSIQTMYVDDLDSAPGTVSQVRAGAQALIRYAKEHGTALVLVGHVTKEGTLAGPRVLEHMVDTVLYFEGERTHQFRILRSVKNRFGATDEIGVFEMTDKGLGEVANPSALFVTERGAPVSGAAVFAGMEGTRPVLVEIQALVAPSSFGTPRRAVVGWDTARLAMVVAVLEARCGLSFGAADIYLSVAGGLRVSEPAADLAVAAALVSSLADQPLPERLVVFGEVALSGEVRPVGQQEARLKEAAKLGFETAILPPYRGPGGGMRLETVGELHELVARYVPDAPNAGRRAARMIGDAG